MTEVLFLLNNTFKVAFKYLVNVFILLNIVFNLRLNIKVKIYPKMRTFKNLEKIKKKNKWQLCLVRILHNNTIHLNMLRICNISVFVNIFMYE